MAVNCPECGHEIQFLRKWTIGMLLEIDKWLSGVFTGRIKLECRDGLIMGMKKPNWYNAARDRKLEDERRSRQNADRRLIEGDKKNE